MQSASLAPSNSWPEMVRRRSAATGGGGRPQAGLYSESRMSAAEAEQYLLTMRARVRAQQAKARKAGGKA